MAVFAWPIAVVAFGIVFLLIFKSHIGRFIDRTKSVGRDGVKAFEENNQATEPQQPDALVHFLESYHSPLLLEMETYIKAEEDTRGLTNQADLVKALRKSLAGVLILWQFEQIYSAIYTSQVATLLYLNGRAPQLTPEADLMSFYNDAAAAYPTLYENRPFATWLSYLSSHTLVVRQADGVVLTTKGREFLKWRVDDGRNGPFRG